MYKIIEEKLISHPIQKQNKNNIYNTSYERGDDVIISVSNKVTIKGIITLRQKHEQIMSEKRTEK